MTLKEAMQQLEETEERILFAIDEDGRLSGSVTDGDLRRWILANDSLDGSAEAVCNKHPYAVPTTYRMDDVRRVMLERNIACIPVVTRKCGLSICSSSAKYSRLPQSILTPSPT